MKKLLVILLTAALLFGCLAYAEEDGQNPAMNFIGDYQDSVGQRAIMHIDAIGNDGAQVTISWANDAFETVVWCFGGQCADVGGDVVINYADGTKTIVTTAKDGTSSETTEYENGTGSLRFTEDQSKGIWQDDVEDAGKDCVFEYVAVDNATGIGSVALGDGEADILAALGEPAEEKSGAELKELVYTDVEIADHPMNVHIFISDDMARAIRLASHAGNSDVANDLSEMMADMGNDCFPEISEEMVEAYAEQYCEVTDVSMLTYAVEYAKDGSLLLYIRTSEQDINLLMLDHYLQV